VGFKLFGLFQVLSGFFFGFPELVRRASHAPVGAKFCAEVRLRQSFFQKLGAKRCEIKINYDQYSRLFRN